MQQRDAPLRAPSSCGEQCALIPGQHLTKALQPGSVSLPSLHCAEARGPCSLLVPFLASPQYLLHVESYLGTGVNSLKALHTLRAAPTFSPHPFCPLLLLLPHSHITHMCTHTRSHSHPLIHADTLTQAHVSHSHTQCTILNAPGLIQPSGFCQDVTQQGRCLLASCLSISPS